MEKILKYYGFASIAEASKEFGFYNEKTTETFLKELYEEDILWEED